MKNRFKILCMILFGIMVFLSILAAIVRRFITHKPVDLVTLDMTKVTNLFNSEMDFTKFNLEEDASNVEKVFWQN